MGPIGDSGGGGGGWGGGWGWGGRGCSKCGLAEPCGATSWRNSTALALPTGIMLECSSATLSGRPAVGGG